MTTENQRDRDRIAEEAVGQRHDGAPPDDVSERERMSPEETARRTAWSVGPQASVSEKTAESVGERAGDAYSDPGHITQTRSHPSAAAHPALAAGRQFTEIISRQFAEQPFIMTVAAFAVGYMTAALLHGRIRTAPGPFQITTPPQGSGYPRGFVESAVLKTISEHPQGMTAAEILKELDPEHIDRHSIDNALGVLVDAKKVRLQEGGGKYISAAAEVPTAPDQPSS
jgi:hypothetical protein